MLNVGHSSVCAAVARVKARHLILGDLWQRGAVGAVDEVGELEAGGARGGRSRAGEPGDVKGEPRLRCGDAPAGWPSPLCVAVRL